MNFKILFNRLGFGKNAHRVYEALLNNKKPMLISHIAQAAEVDRPEVYKNIELCIDRGFIERTMIGKRSYYVAKSPKYIHDALKKSLREIGHFVEVETKKIEKELHKIYKNNRTRGEWFKLDFSEFLEINDIILHLIEKSK